MHFVVKSVKMTIGGVIRGSDDNWIEPNAFSKLSLKCCCSALVKKFESTTFEQVGLSAMVRPWYPLKFVIDLRNRADDRFNLLQLGSWLKFFVTEPRSRSFWLESFEAQSKSPFENWLHSSELKGTIPNVDSNITKLSTWTVS